MISNPKKIVEEFFAHYSFVLYKKGETIIRAEDQPPGVFYLKKGFVRMSLLSEKGEFLILHIFKPGSFFPMTWVVNNTPNRYYFEALTVAELYRAPKQDVLAFLSRHPEVLFDVGGRILAGVSGMLARLEQLVLENAYAKTLLLLLYYARQFGTKTHGSVTLTVPLTHREVAAWIGTTRETASLQIEALKHKRVISYKGRQLVINDVAKLEEELGNGSIH